MKTLALVVAWWFAVYYPTGPVEVMGPFASPEQCAMIQKWVGQVGLERRVRMSVSPCWADGT